MMYDEHPLMPLDDFQQQFHAALIEAGYDTHEKILELIREVKLELARETGLLPNSSCKDCTADKLLIE